MNTKKKIMVIFGTRPEATKMCPVVQELKQQSDWFDTKVVVTGQHREQLYQALSHFSLSPDLDLRLMKENQSLAYFTSAAIAGLDNVLAEDKPDMILVHGDTQTAMCGGLAAFFHKIPVGHVEAGLRSHNKYSPWPEEVNRRIVDAVTDLLFAPTSVGKDNLLREGYSEGHIYITGQTAVDAALQTYKENYTFSEAALHALVQHPGRIITVTAHRRENYGTPMQNMFRAIRRIADNHPDTAVIYPVHMSPVVRDAAHTLLSGHDRIHLLNTLEYPDMINLLARSYLIMSDSGGLQEETTVFNKPLVLMRDTTERPEAVDANMVALAGTEEDSIFNIANRLLSDEQTYLGMTKASNPFGDGQASKRIVQIIANHFGFTSEQTIPFKG
ncbi:UDP-N-acetylglucosamine 2-epimerase (non-hydrolyzing) [Paenibacillus alvei]|uniref:UDP-N-acetylglucosamine 2-epimerase (non-hydrolyzing) n=1 Tax=Paenibacillus alvei TaxID=44250 RepID=A0ABT4GTP1_PAEAL|nr:UDP-N-acetylglucosamine 2-epimerase (non-hydrolyzing) [Paenibacillus alvei]EJW17765.1 UDP-N-acetylglucosamine 2-epimerase MnaA [Paenibacillus alvei DSM 29]MCY9543144.1 UDP-N-acetylglucosamine 2-epimerase (non-hydrolyzing) [Paenibacillus alvei]MCY9707237.1 UDP-N-acetylglucosamine 2-epimerase (non-hydrolyzing) [Paenibacillus alvei]MCY9733661.1 UDP-N-acetylglucosamine 2-epimerase (non-hydrolyzing) [Paenibacillus alvei]MCY9755435.1 UDP-N-acetylglucosamine 2-epimerase (non-hydrolyzing) [Paenibac